MNSEWFNNVETIIDHSSKEYISKRDYAFYQIWRLKNIALQIENKIGNTEKKESLNCKQDFSYIVNNLDLLINKSGNNKSEYENRLEGVVKYLKIEYKVYLPLYFASYFSFAFMLIAFLLFLLLSFLLFPSPNWMLLLIVTGGFAAFGYFVGTYKDFKIKKEGRQI